MKYWLLKSEPDVWSIDQQKEAGIEGAERLALLFVKKHGPGARTMSM